MKIKVKPQDFVVREVIDLPVLKEGKFYLYRMDKVGRTTLEVIEDVRERFRISEGAISYGGKKDRKAVTSQYLTVKKSPHLPERIRGEGYNLIRVGETDWKMGPSRIRSNEFQVVIRDLESVEAERCIREVEAVKEDGFVNYFDEQRFGSFSPEQGFIGEKIIRRHFRGALKIYMTHVYRGGGKDEKKRKRFFLENWGKWDECMKHAVDPFEKKVFKVLKERGKRGFVEALSLIPREEMSLFFSAFQSYLWNLMAQEIVDIFGEEIVKFRGKFFTFTFFKRASDPGYVRKLSFPVPSKKSEMPDDLTSRIYRKVLESLKIEPSMFNVNKVKSAYFKPHTRAFIVFPDVHAVDLADDEIVGGKKKITLKFTLPRGAYATMFLKRLFAS